MSIGRTEYLKRISGVPTNSIGTIPAEPNKRIQAALEKALDIRKFEIELYWKRAHYFWAFIVTIYATFFLVYKELPSNNDTLNKSILLFCLSTLGFIFAIGWHMVNRASKFWQQNWEHHVDALEDNVYGPLYKTVIVKPEHGVMKGCWYSPLGAYPFSVSNVNCLLSFCIIIFSGLLLVVEAYQVADKLVDVLCVILKLKTVIILVLVSAATYMFAIRARGNSAKEYLTKNTKNAESSLFILRDK
ncbi:MAG: hypothetical protein WCP79_14335 [Bacillota bacterium]